MQHQIFPLVIVAVITMEIVTSSGTIQKRITMAHSEKIDLICSVTNIDCILI